MNIERLFELSGIEYISDTILTETADSFNNKDDLDESFGLFKELRLLENVSLEMFEYNGSCVNCDIFRYDATRMSNAIDDSQLLKPEYLELTNIFQVSPKSVQKFFTNRKPVVIGYTKNLVWLYYMHVDKHFFYTADDYLKIPEQYFEHNEMDRGI